MVNDSYQRLNTEGKKKRDVPNIADYSIWYLQLPLKKKEEKNQPIQIELHVHSTIIQTWLTSPTAGASLMASSATLATSWETIHWRFCSKKKVCSSPGSWFLLLLNEHKRMIGQGRHGNNSSSEVKNHRGVSASRSPNS